MARASASRGKRPRSNARAKQAEQRVTAKPEKKKASYEDQLFFSRLRRRSKWVFAFLAGVFALSFVALGVGTGVSGTSVGDILADVFGRSDSGPSVADAQKKVDESPNDPEALSELATALQSAGRNDEAIAVLKSYTKVRPEDASALRQLAALYEIKATNARRLAQDLLVQISSGNIAATAFTFPGASGFFGALGDDPIVQALQTSSGARANVARQEATTAYEEQVPVFERLVELIPDEPTLYIQLAQAADGAGEGEKAISAYEKFLEVAPDHPLVPDVRQQLRQLGVTPDELTG